MSVRFPDEPGFQGRFAPVRLEGDIRGVEVTQGEIPASLRGTFYRVGADPAWPPFVDRDFYFNADGMVAMFRFENGYCDFRSRYVRTPRFEAERAARRSLFGAYRNPFTDDPSVAGLSRGLANTNVYWHGGRLLASKEDSAPVQIDPDTLDTVGEFSLGRRPVVADGDRAPEDRPAHRRAGVLRLHGQGRGDTGHRLLRGGRVRADRARGLVRGAVLVDGARLGGDGELRGVPDHPAHRQPGAAEGRRPAVRVGRVGRRLPRRRTEKGNRRPLVPGHQQVRLAHHERVRRRAAHPHRHARRREVRLSLVPRHHGRPVRPGEGERAAVPVDDRHHRAAGPGRRDDRRSRSGGSPTAPASSPAPTTAGRPGATGSASST